MYLASTPAGNEVLDSPLALLIGMVLDQQVRMEKAFDGPAVLIERIGRDLDARDLASRNLSDVFCAKPAMHRYCGAMGARVVELCRIIVDRYDGDAAAIWRDVPSGAELYKRIKALPGFGEQKAQIFVALLGKQLGVRPQGWRQAAGQYGADRIYKSVADAIDERSVARVREYKQAQKAADRASG